jgi:hypothetical protein
MEEISFPVFVDRRIKAFYHLILAEIDREELGSEFPSETSNEKKHFCLKVFSSQRSSQLEKNISEKMAMESFKPADIFHLMAFSRKYPKFVVLNSRLFILKKKGLENICLSLKRGEIVIDYQILDQGDGLDFFLGAKELLPGEKTESPEEYYGNLFFDFSYFYKKFPNLWPLERLGDILRAFDSLGISNSLSILRLHPNTLEATPRQIFAINDYLNKIGLSGKDLISRFPSVLFIPLDELRKNINFLINSKVDIKKAVHENPKLLRNLLV